MRIVVGLVAMISLWKLLMFLEDGLPWNNLLAAMLSVVFCLDSWTDSLLSIKERLEGRDKSYRAGTGWGVAGPEPGWWDELVRMMVSTVLSCLLVGFIWLAVRPDLLSLLGFGHFWPMIAILLAIGLLTEASSLNRVWRQRNGLAETTEAEVLNLVDRLNKEGRNGSGPGSAVRLNEPLWESTTTLTYDRALDAIRREA